MKARIKMGESSERNAREKDKKERWQKNCSWLTFYNSFFNYGFNYGFYFRTKRQATQDKIMSQSNPLKNMYIFFNFFLSKYDNCSLQNKGRIPLK